MFEAVELGIAIDKKSYARELPRVREALLAAQRKLAASNQSCLVLIGGEAVAGKGETIDSLLAWTDARGVRVHTFLDRTQEEKQHPPAWRFWRALPATGHTAIFFGSWYTRPLVERAYRESSNSDFDRELRHIAELERMLSAEGVLIFKVWLHLSRKAQRERIEKMRDDELGRTRITPRDLRDARNYHPFRAAAEQMVRITSTPESPWQLVDAEHRRYRNLTVARLLTQAIEQRLQAAASAAKAAKRKRPAPKLPVPPKENLLSQLDLTRSLTGAEAEAQLRPLQARLSRASRALNESKRSAILLFEGPDAAGKGGAIRRLTDPMDARIYQVHSVVAPTEEELAHPYLWRFWRDLPRRGTMTIYDRSWYGRVLVERLEGFTPQECWQRAYGEINAFEENLVEAGALVLKFWLAISPREQLRRFKSRQLTPYKQYKLGPEDWRNREKWDGYEAAACDMFEKTSTERAPWHLIPADDKKWARGDGLKRTVHALEKMLGL